MWYTRKSENGYTPPQSTKAAGLVALPDEMLETFLAYSGFVELEISEGVAVAITPDVKAFEAWESEQTEAESIEPKDAQADIDAMLVDHEYRLTLLELGLTE